MVLLLLLLLVVVLVLQPLLRCLQTDPGPCRSLVGSVVLLVVWCCMMMPAGCHLLQLG
jgi:hypothetical protein